MRAFAVGSRFVWASLAFSFAADTARAAELQEPITLQSQNGILDILLVAKAAAIPTLSPLNPTGWVYDVCLNPHNGANDCPAKPASAKNYGGTRLQLFQGDTLKIHLVNKLPPVTDADHAKDPGEAFLALNPTNLHTHGLLVSPHYPSKANPAYGDNVFVMTFNSANGKPAVSKHLHAAVDFDATDYEIKIPANHPSGLFWFHPHVHGISLNQVSAGMAGIITVGNVGDYVCSDSGCRRFAGLTGVRHIILKDTQVLSNSKLMDQEDPNFCEPPEGAAPKNSSWQGFCPGQDERGDGGGNYTGGRWFFTLNGQQFPDIPIRTPGGEIWRITNASASATYDLRLWNPALRQDMIFQVLALDGVSISPEAGTPQSEIAQTAGKRVSPVPCPGVKPGLPRGGQGQPLCTARLHMMPSSRAEIWVAYRDAHGTLAAPPPGAKAIFRTAGFLTGPDADNWPAVDLGTVLFRGPKPQPHMPAALSLRGGAPALTAPRALAADFASANAAVGSDPSCKPLPKGHKRRIFFNVPAGLPDGFGLGYEELDENNVPVPGTFMDVKPFDPMTPTVCLPLGPGNAPVSERWELVNLANEDHNFHIHQVRFRVLSAAEIDGTSSPSQIFSKGVVLDSVPLLHADGDGCASVEDWRKGHCTAHPAWVEIPFAIAGDFVYHCHILEHEDGGMMAVIRVRPNSG
jgi:FtsP/CotA-like multicopper oxidase with cupredoxin domain